MKSLDKNTRVLLAGAVLVGLMIGLSFASVPLYTIFCRATGLGGTTQRLAGLPNNRSGLPQGQSVRDRYVTVTFDGNVDPALPWDFAPDVRNIRVKIGEPTTVTYHAHNRSDQTLIGTATYNVQPDKVGLYFDKVMCFCFTKQTLKPHQTVTMGVTFYIDPAIAESRENDDVQNITLSYTFFLFKNQAKVHVANQDSTAVLVKTK